MKKIILFILFSTFYYSSKAQLENAQWRFFHYAGLSFTTSPPAFVACLANGGQGACSSIADASGNLLFYVSGYGIHDRFDQSMNGGSISINGGATFQGVIIVKKPGSNMLYYVFGSGPSGLRYSIVDMSLFAGTGSVTVVNQPLTTQRQANKVAATRHCNGSDIWIVSQDDTMSTWRAYLLTSSGISSTVTSNAVGKHVAFGALKFSPDGTKIASAGGWDGLRIYDFDKSTGAVSGMTLAAGTASSVFASGVEFSPDGSKLYAGLNNGVYQWDLAAGSASAVAASQYTVWQTPSSGTYTWTSPGALQLAIDGKIYQANNNNNSVLSVINNPNGTGAASNYSLYGLTYQYVGASYGLPNQMKPIPPHHSISYTISQVTCNTAQFAPVVGTLGGINSIPPASVSWNFGDPASGTSNLSSQSSTSHIYSAPGTYTVKMMMTYAGCTSPDTIVQTVSVPNNAPVVSVSGNTMICFGETTTLTASGATNFNWASSLGISSGASIIVTPTASVVFVLSSSNSGGCVAQSNVSVSLIPQSVFQVTGPTETCAGESVTLTASGTQSFTWTTSSGPLGTGSSLYLTPYTSVAYTVLGTNTSNTCVSHQAYNLAVYPYPQLSVSSSTQICAGQFLVLGATGATTYSWNYSGGLAVGPSFTWQLSSSETFTVSASDPNNPCISKDVVQVVVNACTGLADVKNDAVKIYPSPFHEQLYIENDEPFSISIIDLCGRVVLNRVGNAGLNSFDLRNLSPGTYFAVISDSRNTVVKKVVKID